MANIKVQDLNRVTGADLFNDSESFMLDLFDRQLDIQGGCGGNHPVKFAANTRPIILIYSCAVRFPKSSF